MKKQIYAVALCVIMLTAGCSDSASNENSTEVESSKALENSEKADADEARETEAVETDIIDETEIQDDYVALAGDGTGFVTETYSNTTYSIPDTWTKKENDNAIWYKDNDNGGLLYVSATPYDDIDDIDIQNMLVDAPIQGIKRFDGYSDWGTNEAILEYGNKGITTLYTYENDGNIYAGEAMIFNDLEATVSMIYTIPVTQMSEEGLNVIANDIFGSIQLINTP